MCQASRLVRLQTGVYLEIAKFQKSLFYRGSWTFHSTGWRRSAIRAGLRENSLQTGNFSAKIQIFRSYERLITAKMAALQGFLKKFPKDLNRETSRKSRELRIQNRDRVSAYLIKSN